MAKKIEIQTEIFDRLWQDMTDKLRELKPELKHAIDFEQNKTGSCEILAQVLNKDRCKGNTIYKEYFTPLVQAKRMGKSTVLIGAHFPEWLTELIHGPGATFEQYYLPVPQESNQYEQVTQQLIESYSLPRDQQQVFRKLIQEKEANNSSITLKAWFNEQLWLKRLILLGSIMAGISLLGIIGLAIGKEYFNDSQQKVIQGMQFVWIFLAAIFVFQRSTHAQYLDSPTLARASNGQNRLLSYWLRLWGVWLLLYASWFAQGLIGAPLQNVWFNLWINAINLGTALYLYLMYLEMSKETETATQHLHVSVKYYVFLMMYIFIEGLAVWFNQELTGMFSILSGFLTATATFLFISRLNSKILDIPPTFIHILIMYAAIQPMISYIIDSESVILETLLTTLAFAAKIILLCIIMWLQDTFRILHYMVRIYHVHKDEQVMREVALRYFNEKGDLKS